MPHRDSHAAAAVCFCGQIRTLPALAPRLRTHVLEAMQSPVDSFLSLSVDTLRGQLKSVFRKTGTRRQNELAAMILRSPALRAAETLPIKLS